MALAEGTWTYSAAAIGQSVNRDVVVPPLGQDPCADALLVWGRGTQTTSGLWKSAVHIGQGSDVQGNVGAIGDVDINGTGWIHGDLTGQSQFIGIMPPHVSGAFNVPGVPTPPTLPAPVVIPAIDTPGVAMANYGSFTPVAGNSYGAITGGGGCKVYFTAGTYYFDSFSLANGGKLYFDLTGGPVKIYVKKQFKVGSATNSYLTNGDASMIFLESQWDGTAGQPYGFSHAGGSWHGTVVTRESGIKFGTGQASGIFEGYMWSDWDGKVGAAANAIALSIDIQHGARIVRPPCQ